MKSFRTLMAVGVVLFAVTVAKQPASVSAAGYCSMCAALCNQAYLRCSDRCYLASPTGIRTDYDCVERCGDNFDMCALSCFCMPV